MLKKHSWILWLAAGCLTVMAAAAGWYAFYWIKTPEYSAGLIRESYETKNFSLFQKKVDLPALYGSVYDDAAAELAETGHVSQNPLTLWAVKRMKGPAVEEMIRQTQNAFEQGGGADPGNPLSEQWITRLENRAGTAALSLSDIISVSRNGQEAVLSLRLHDQNLNRDFIWKIEMVPSSDGSWKAVKIINFRDYLKERSHVLQQNQKEENP